MNYIYIIALLTASLFISCSKGDTTVFNDENGNHTEVDTSQNEKPTGSSANDLLAENTFTKIVVEVVYVTGFKPTTTTINSFKSFLQNRLHKSDGIQIIQREIPSTGMSSYSVDDIIALETTHRTKYNSNNEIAVLAFFLNGAYAGNTNNSSVLGIANRNTSFVIFEETIREYSFGVLAPDLSVLETTVINHEFGHILGLVNT
ncbi:MAG: membrane metalloprotease [Flavobacteriaceae bacterium]|nr:membrane metalloprotease [Flavobacteriaceae bacterium]